MIFETKRWKTSIEFRDQFIDYIFNDKSTKSEETKQIRYEDITNDYSTKYEPVNLSFVLLNLIFLILNFLALFAPFVKFIGAIGFMFGSVIFLIFTEKAFNGIRVIKLHEGEMKIAKRKETLGIYQEIISRRNEYLRKTYAQVNWNNTPEYEIGKFGWLSKLRVITEEEREQFLKEISSK